jgi:hypothetical protein
MDEQKYFLKVSKMEIKQATQVACLVLIHLKIRNQLTNGAEILVYPEFRKRLSHLE